MLWYSKKALTKCQPFILDFLTSRLPEDITQPMKSHYKRTQADYDTSSPYLSCSQAQTYQTVSSIMHQLNFSSRSPRRLQCKPAYNLPAFSSNPQALFSMFLCESDLYNHCLSGRHLNDYILLLVVKSKHFDMLSCNSL